jgi:hypothetical protein
VFNAKFNGRSVRGLNSTLCRTFRPVQTARQLEFAYEFIDEGTEMKDRPAFEIEDGAVVHPLIRPLPGDLSASAIIDGELAALMAYCRRGGGGEPWYCGLP